MSDKVYTIEDIKEYLYPVFSKHNVKKAVLFGSYVKGKANKNSDIDLLLDSGLKGLRFVGLIQDIHSALDKEVDVFDITHIVQNSQIYTEINKDGITIYEG